MGDLAITWDRFTVRRTSDAGPAAPYLWVFGIRVDLDTIASRRFVVTRDATYPNLGPSALGRGESTRVPSALDLHLGGIRPVGGRTVAGVVVMAWESTSTIDEVVQKAYDDAADEIDHLVATSVDHAADDVLHERLPTPPSGYDISGFADAIEARVRRTITDRWTVLQPIADHFVGCDHVVIDLVSSHRERLDLRFRNGSTDDELRGSFAYAV